jgi:hypothetical protein
MHGSSRLFADEGVTPLQGKTLDPGTMLPLQWWQNCLWKAILSLCVSSQRAAILNQAKSLALWLVMLALLPERAGGKWFIRPARLLVFLLHGPRPLPHDCTLYSLRLAAPPSVGPSRLRSLGPTSSRARPKPRWESVADVLESRYPFQTLSCGRWPFIPSSLGLQYYTHQHIST